MNLSIHYCKDYAGLMATGQLRLTGADFEFSFLIKQRSLTKLGNRIIWGNFNEGVLLELSQN